ncbi:type IV pilin protein [Propionispora vibrioides]|uniref:Type II secretion system protein G (GspG) n=1 Tax=Propionispora vibrioides TaxID=112903 RepID=A0A1H8NZR7_9FIRM|nr:prepilin-type N-terminal cleavage/methylation domain-containing protein [Propionispora vibrioides]SEO35156.1 type II secretion system protein G (GspG) [Propionispora vibrioides]
MIFKKIRTLLKRQQGFTLIELLVVVAIMGILAAIAIPKYVDSTASANGAKMMADLQALDSAIQQYTADHGGTAPAAIANLNTYFAGDTIPTAPTGKFKGKHVTTATDIPAGGYTLGAEGADAGRAVIGNYRADEI